MTDEDFRLRAVTVNGLLPASRYRARVRCADRADDGSICGWPDWSLSPISEWFLTQRACLLMFTVCSTG